MICRNDNQNGTRDIVATKYVGIDSVGFNTALEYVSHFFIPL